MMKMNGLTALLICTAIHAQAQVPVDKQQLSHKQLDTVTVRTYKTVYTVPVTAGKLAANPMDIPQSVAVITKATIENQQAVKLSEVISNTTGVYLYGTTGGSQEEIGGRGYAFNSTNTFKNGVRYNNSAMPEVSSLEKVEILKGSAAILFGNVAAGGILNLVTKKPQFTRGGEISFRTGSNDFYKPYADIFGPLNAKKTIAYRLNGSYESARSFRDIVHSNRLYINPSIQWNAGKKTSFLLEADLLKDKRTLDYGTGAVDYVIANIPRQRFLGANWSYNDIRQSSITFTANRKLGDGWNLAAIGGLQDFKGDLFGTTRPNASSQFVKPDGNWIRGLQRTETNERYYLAEADLTGKIHTGKIIHQVLIGADADWLDPNTLAYVYQNPLAANKNIYDSVNIYEPSKYVQRTDMPALKKFTLTASPVRRAGVYAQDLVSLSKQWKVLAGIRYSTQQAHDGRIDTLTTGKGNATANVSDHAFSPRLGIVFQPKTHISLFGSYSNSFVLNTGTDVYGKALDPSLVDQYEAGFKSYFFHHHLTFGVTTYLIRNSNMAQVSLTDANGNPNNNSLVKELAGEITSKGVEAEFTIIPQKGFDLSGGYSYNETRYTKSNTYIVGSLLRYNPMHTAHLAAYYHVPASHKAHGLSVGMIANYIGERVGGRSTRIQVANDKYRLMPIPDYVQVDATAGYVLGQYSLKVKMSNIFNVLSYNVHDDNSINPIAPRQFSFTAGVRLGL